MAKSSAFGERLAQLREAAGISQYELAKRSGVSGPAIAFLERGERQPSWETVRKLARGLGVNVLAFDVPDQNTGQGEGIGPPAEPEQDPIRPLGKRK